MKHNINKYRNDYLLSNIKLDNFYLLWNSKKNYLVIKILLVLKIMNIR